MARVTAYGASLGGHAAAVAAIVIVPLFGPEPPVAVRPSTVVDHFWPSIVPVVLAAPQRAPARAPRKSPRDAPLSPSLSQPPSLAPSLDTAVDSPPADARASTASAADASSSGLLLDGSQEPSGGAGGAFGGPVEGLGGHEPGTPRRIGGDLSPPAKRVHVQPEYPPLARLARVRGTVVLDCTIDPAGNVVDVRLLSGHPLLDAAAADAVRRWRYLPTRLNGVPVAVLLTVKVRFELSR